MAQRDYGLDLLKGLGCLGMVIAHYTVGVVTTAPNPLSVLVHLGSLAPVLFFSVTGVTTIFQARTYPLRYLLAFYLLFALFGLAYNFLFLQGIDPASPLRSDIPQIIAAAVLVIAGIERGLRGHTGVYLGLAGALCALHLLVTRALGSYPLSGWLTEGSFPLVPWLAFPLLGVAAYRARPRALAAAVAALGAALALALLLPNEWAAWTHKWNMTWRYLLVTLFVLCGAFLLVKLRPVRSPRHPLVWCGRRSFLFLFLHLLLIQFVLRAPAIRHPLLAWPLLIAGTALAMWGLLAAARWLAPLFRQPVTWAAVLAAILAAPVVLTGHPQTLIVVEGLLGVLLGANYPHLAAMLKRWLVPHPAPKTPEPAAMG